MQGGERYNSIGNYLKKEFGRKMVKLSIDAGFICPNRDGSLAYGGCAFCSEGGSGELASHMQGASSNIHGSISEQIDKLSEKWPDAGYIAYFQSYTNTYGNIEKLKRMYEAALSVEDVIGISIATRPDCVSDELLDYLEELSHRTFLTMEYGVESLNDDTLRIINRGHSSECSINIIRNTHARGITVCAHLILGLPGEGREEILRQIDIVNALPIDILKLHQLQITKGTILEHRPDLIAQCTLFTPEEYIDLLVEYILRLRDDIVIERFTSQSPAELLIAPRWGLKNHEFTNLLNKKLRSEN